MLTFKTQFPVNPEKSTSDLIEAGRIWLAGSPFYKLAPKLSLASNIGDEWQASEGSEAVVFAKHEGEEDLCGISFENIDENAIRWVTEIVGSKRNDSFWVSIELRVDSELPVERIDHGRTPHILKTIMREIGGGNDGRLLVSDKPTYLREDQLELAADIVTAHAGCVMPVVYVSVDNGGHPYVDAEKMAHWLSGMAHVVVEPSRRFSFDLMHLVHAENAYGGAVAIYWPDGIGKWLFLPKGIFADPLEMQLAISRKVRMSLLSQRTRRDCTWRYVQEVRAKRRIQALLDSGSSKVEEYVAMFDQELSGKNEEIQRLENEINRLKYGSRQPGNSSVENGLGIALQCSEKDLYQGERQSVITDALSRELAACEPFSRRATIVQDILNSNDQPGQRDSILEELKEVYRQYSSMTASNRATLERLGFEIGDEGKHYKLTFRGDERYPSILSKTGSDSRGGLNAFSDLKKKLF